MIFAIPYMNETKAVLIQVAPGMPPDFWWVTAGVLVILALTATVDAYRAIIPEVIIFSGLLAVTATQGLYASWDIAGHHLRQAVAAGLLFWAINFAWACKFRYDALGMGDAKWTMLAIACFGITPVVLAWGLGALLATALVGIMRLVNYRMTEITFSPFLLIGLGVGLYLVRFW